MRILLGNLTIKDLEEKHGFTLSDEDRAVLQSMRQDSAQKIEKDKFHIFDIPRNIVCGDSSTCQKVYNILKEYKIKGSVGLTYQN